jgi:UDP-N-acetylmuramoylalanine-D-glutamate ligase
MEAAMAANVSRYMVKTGKGAAHIQNGLPAHIQPVAIADNLAEAVKEMLADAA